MDTIEKDTIRRDKETLQKALAFKGEMAVKLGKKVREQTKQINLLTAQLELANQRIAGYKDRITKLEARLKDASDSDNK